jgi:hypothetical protein
MKKNLTAITLVTILTLLIAHGADPIPLGDPPPAVASPAVPPVSSSDPSVQNATPGAEAPPAPLPATPGPEAMASAQAGTPPAVPPAPGPSMDPSAMPIPDKTAEQDEKKRLAKARQTPFVTERQYFTYAGLNSQELNLKKLDQLTCAYAQDLYPKNPKKLFDLIGMVILVQRALIGGDIQTMSPRQRHDVVLNQFLFRMRQMGAYQAWSKFDAGLESGKIAYPSIDVMCTVLEKEKSEILHGLGHYKKLFNNT